MERVHFQQEQMLPELKDLVEKELFTENEIRQIIKQRTTFETALVRRVAKKADFIRYISYEMDLEALRKKRVKRMDLPKAPATVSDYAFVRRQFHIFERALKRFKSDVGLWIQYIQLAKREGARALVGRVTARALQLHPNNPTFYILAASHELENLSPSAARALLQRGIRANPDSVDMWKEYVKMELGFIESMRRRWDVLGIKLDAEKARKGKQKELEEADPSPDTMDESLEGNDSYESPKMDVDEDDVVEGAEARQQIMEGAIVQSVIANAAQSLPKIELFVALKTVISEYPSPVALQQTLLDCLFDVLAKTFPRDPKGMEMRAQRHLKGHPSAVDFVDGLRAANEEMLGILGEGSEEALLETYATFVETWCERVEDDHLKTYLISSLKGLIQKNPRSGPLLATHIKQLMKTGTAPAKLRKTAEKYSRKAPESAQVWLARLEIEKTHAAGTVRDVWAEARKKVRGSLEEVVQVWTWGLSSGGEREAQKGMHEELLRESMEHLSLHGVHEALLVNYVTLVAPDGPATGGSSDQEGWIHTVRHMASRYLTTAKVWETVFGRVDGGSWTADEKAPVLKMVHEQWRERDEVGATVRWARWLLAQGRGTEATGAVVESRRRLGGSAEELDVLWMEVVG